MPNQEIGSYCIKEGNMPATLDDLIKIEGVTVAFEYTADGRVTEYRARDLSPEMAALIARYCALVTMTFNILAGAFTALSEENWVPQRGWIYVGGDYTVVIGNGGYRGVFIETTKVNLSELMTILTGQS
jgi:roadblock/LC7 domain-containing protein